MYKLRQYQDEAIQAIRDLQKGDNGIISLPVGSGKTIIMSSVAKEIKGRVLIVVPSTELREQTIEKLEAVIDDPSVTIGSVQGNINELDTKIVIATRQSLTHKKSTRMEQMKEFGEFELIFFDEAHQAPLQLEKIVKQLSGGNAKLIGMSGTPFNVEMRRVFDKIIYEKDILWMIKNKYLCPPRAYKINTKTDLNKVRTVAGEFNQKDLEDTVNNNYRNKLIVKAYKQYASDRDHTIAFCSGIDHCRDLCSEFIKQGIKCGYIDSTLNKEERETTLNKFKNGEYEVITNVGVLTTGFDFPAINNLLLCRPTKSKILYIQSLGRGLRLSPETLKEDCLVLDFMDVVTKHNIMSMNTIFNIDFKNGETVDEALDRKEREEKEEQERQQQELLRLEELRKQEEELIAQEIDLFNTNLDLAFNETYYDWFKISDNMFALSQECDVHYVVVKCDDEFYTFEVYTTKEKQLYKELEVFTSVVDAIEYCENRVVNAYGGYAYRKTKWKAEDATEKQLICIRYNREQYKTKWDVHKYFKTYLIKKILKEGKLDNNEVHFNKRQGFSSTVN